MLPFSLVSRVVINTGFFVRRSQILNVLFWGVVGRLEVQ